METSNNQHPTSNIQWIGRWTIMAVFFACLGGGFAVPILSASELSISETATNAPLERTLGESDLLALLTDSLQANYVKDKGDLELRLVRPWTPRTVPNEPLMVKILNLPTSGVSPSFIVRFELRTADRSIGTWSMAMQARVWREVWVAHTTLKRGQAISEADVVRDRRDVLNVRDALADFSSSDTTLELAESVQANAPLLARMVKARTVIHRGQAADALIQDGSLSVSMKVEALEDGAPGQTIRARNPISRRELFGKVLNEQTILISL